MSDTPPTNKWHRLTKQRPNHMQWIILIYAPKGRRNEDQCEWITERIFRFQRDKYYNVFRSRNGVNFILSPEHERDAVWCALPSGPPHLKAWGNDERFTAK